MSNILTRQDLASGAAERWKYQYFQQGKWISLSLSDPRDTYASLLKLGPHPDPDDVDLMIGNESWTYLECSHCEQRVDEVAVFVRYDEVVYVCEPCLWEVLEEFE